MRSLLKICCMLMFCAAMNMAQTAYATTTDTSTGEQEQTVATLEQLRTLDPKAYNRFMEVLGGRENAFLALHEIRIIHDKGKGSYMYEYRHGSSGPLTTKQYHVDPTGHMSVVAIGQDKAGVHEGFSNFKLGNNGNQRITPVGLAAHQTKVRAQEKEEQRLIDLVTRNVIKPALNQSPTQEPTQSPIQEPTPAPTGPTPSPTPSPKFNDVFDREVLNPARDQSPTQEPTQSTIQEGPTQVAESGSGAGTVSGAGPQPSGNKGDIDSMRIETVERAINASSAQDRQDAIDKVKAAPGDYVSTLQKMLNNAKDANSSKTILDISARSRVPLDQYQAAQGFVRQLIDLLGGNDGKAALGPLSAASALDKNISSSVMGTAVQLIRERLDTATSPEEKTAVYKLAQEAGISMPAPTAPTTSLTPAPTPTPTASPTPNPTPSPTPSPTQSPTPSPTESRIQLPIQTPSNPALSQAPSLPGRVPSTRELGQRSVAKSRSMQKQMPSESSAQTEDTKRYKVTGENEKAEMK